MPRPPTKKPLITLTLLLALAMFPISWILFNKAKKVENEVNQYQDNRQLEEENFTEDMDSIDEKSLMESLLLKKLQVPVKKDEKEAHIDVYWKTNSEAFLVIKKLPLLQPGEQYEVWSINEKGQTSLGIFPPPPGGTLIVKSPKAMMTDTYDVRVVN